MHTEISLPLPLALPLQYSQDLLDICACVCGVGRRRRRSLNARFLTANLELDRGRVSARRGWSINFSRHGSVAVLIYSLFNLLRARTLPVTNLRAVILL